VKVSSLRRRARQPGAPCLAPKPPAPGP